MSPSFQMPFTICHLPFISHFSFTNKKWPIVKLLKIENCPSTSLRIVSLSSHKLVIGATRESDVC